jgi:hypothetical protein
VIEELDVPRSLSVASDKLLVSRRSLIQRVARQHALYAHTHALGVLHGTPPFVAEKIEADDTVGIYVRMNRYWSLRQLIECDFWGFFVAKEKVSQSSAYEEQKW